MSKRPSPAAWAVLACIALVAAPLLQKPRPVETAGFGQYIAAGQRPAPKGEHQPGRVLVRLEPNASWPAVEPEAHRLSAARVSTIPSLDIQVLEVPVSEERAVTARLSRLPGVRYAEPDAIMHLQAVPAPASSRPRTARRLPVSRFPSPGRFPRARSPSRSRSFQP